MLLLRKQQEPRKAYDLWSEQYDEQPDNLMLALDEDIFSNLITFASLKDKTIADIGCGTGRHWKQLLKYRPARLIGLDISKGMLQHLNEKYPFTETRLISHSTLPLQNNSFDMIISTLVIAHIRKIKKAFYEWNRVLKSGGEIIITDYHPELLGKGGDRTFLYHGKLIAVKNYIHSIEEIRRLAEIMNWQIREFTERKIDEKVARYYEEKGATSIFKKFQGTPLIYGMYLKKRDVFA